MLVLFTTTSDLVDADDHSQDQDVPVIVLNNAPNTRMTNSSESCGVAGPFETGSSSSNTDWNSEMGSKPSLLGVIQ